MSEGHKDAASSAHDRVTALEESVAHHARTIEELSAALADQWKIIDRLEARVRALTGGMEALEAQIGNPGADRKPPHW